MGVAVRGENATCRGGQGSRTFTRPEDTPDSVATRLCVRPGVLGIPGARTGPIWATGESNPHPIIMPPWRNYLLDATNDSGKGLPVCRPGSRPVTENTASDKCPGANPGGGVFNSCQLRFRSGIEGATCPVDCGVHARSSQGRGYSRPCSRHKPFDNPALPERFSNDQPQVQ